MGVTRADIGEVGHHGDLVFVPSQRRESLGHTDFGKAARFLGIKSIFGESKPSTQEDHAFGRNGGGSLGCRKGFEKWQGQDGSAKTQERATGRRVGVEGHEASCFKLHSTDPDSFARFYELLWINIDRWS